MRDTNFSKVAYFVAPRLACLLPFFLGQRVRARILCTIRLRREDVAHHLFGVPIFLFQAP